MEHDIAHFFHSLGSEYDSFREFDINTQFITYRLLEPLLYQLKAYKSITYEIKGYSVQNTPITLIRMGTGPIKIFLWSQMHGDESTGTASLMDLFSFFTKYSGFAEVKSEILHSCTLYIMPLVNPDGAEKWTRENALNIDLNRDRIRLNSPESRVLFNTFHEIKPDFGFNLHDQNPLYSVGATPNQAFFSFLAPPEISQPVELSRHREAAMLLISQMAALLHTLIPGHIGRYSDEIEIRAFGDYFQSCNTATVLIESGACKEDFQKQYIRKLHTQTILSALLAISRKSYEKHTIEEYASIPENQKFLYDLVLRNIHIQVSQSHKIIIDIGINNTYVPSAEKSLSNNHAIIENIADLTGLYGLYDYDFEGYRALPMSNEFLTSITAFYLEKKNNYPIYNLSTETLAVSGEFYHHIADLISAVNYPVIFKQGDSANLILHSNFEQFFLVLNGILIKLIPE
ncbi:MAG: hypothetical protein LWX56_02935 [Ignavibacteria bacterium]|nr:hypothetical protein [Ignavibacteria bacterium]